VFESSRRLRKIRSRSISSMSIDELQVENEVSSEAEPPVKHRDWILEGPGRDLYDGLSVCATICGTQAVGALIDMVRWMRNDMKRVVMQVQVDSFRSIADDLYRVPIFGNAYCKQKTVVLSVLPRLAREHT
jgi:hypothetical protein